MGLTDDYKAAVERIARHDVERFRKNDQKITMEVFTAFVMRLAARKSGYGEDGVAINGKAALERYGEQAKGMVGSAYQRLLKPRSEVDVRGDADSRYGDDAAGGVPHQHRHREAREGHGDEGADAT